MSLSGEQQYSTEVAASVPQCFATITDFEKYPDWFSSVEQTNVLERYRDGLAKRVEYRIDMKLKSIRYVLEYEYQKPEALTWKAVDGDVEAIEGSYLFEKLGPHLSRATCRQAVSIGFWGPCPSAIIMVNQAVKQSVLEFKPGPVPGVKEAARRRANGS